MKLAENILESIRLLRKTWIGMSPNERMKMMSACLIAIERRCRTETDGTDSVVDGAMISVKSVDPVREGSCGFCTRRTDRNVFMVGSHDDHRGAFVRFCPQCLSELTELAGRL